MLRRLDLRAIKDRLAHVSPGPWGWWDIGDSSAGWRSSVAHFADDHLKPWAQWGLSEETAQMTEWSVLTCKDTPTGYDAEFIAHARTDVPALVAEVEWQRLWAERVIHGLGDIAKWTSDPRAREEAQQLIREMQSGAFE